MPECKPGPPNDSKESVCEAMIEMMLFLVGYVLGCAVSSANSFFRKPDRILRWDSNVFAWRPVQDTAAIGKEETVLFAFEVRKKEEESDNEKR